MSRQWAKVSADTISHPDGSSKSPLYVDGIALDKEATASSRTLSINTTSGELQSNDQGTTRPLMARSAAVSHQTMDGVTTAFSANTLTTIPLSWSDYKHKTDNPRNGQESAYEVGPLVCNLYAVCDSTPTWFYVYDGVNNVYLFPDSSDTIAYSWIYTTLFTDLKSGSGSGLSVKSDVAGDARITVNYVGCHDGPGPKISDP